MAGGPLAWWIYDKLARAEHHIATLDAEVTQFLDTRPFRMTSEFKENGDGTHTWVRRAQVKQFEGGTSAVGDAVHNLRSTLNYVVTSLWTIQDAKDDVLRAEFPIFIDPDDFHSIGNTHIKGLPVDAQRIIEDLQPYNRKKNSDPLWLLHYLDEVEKHLNIRLSNYTVLDTAVLDLRSMADVRMISSQVFSGMFDDGTVLAEAQLQFLGDGPEEHEVFEEFPADIALQRAGPATGLFAVPTLAQIAEYIRIEVLPALEPFAQDVRPHPSRSDRASGTETLSLQMSDLGSLEKLESAILAHPGRAIEDPDG
jgi:hypothetical protein